METSQRPGRQESSGESPFFGKAEQRIQDRLEANLVVSQEAGRHDCGHGRPTEADNDHALITRQTVAVGLTR